ncbi:putative WW domain-containing protein [Seiridium unicorne]|uniref:WW domain-containing protein n=1 Tax=Seiridium unicorne TaxID=138068 RepID=A0ABR2UKS9_9PEZI
MLKSTYKGSARPPPPPLPVGWTEHKAPTGHTYYYNTATKESTYKRPGADSATTTTPPAPSEPVAQDPRASYRQYSAVGSLADPAAANAFLAQYGPQPHRPSHFNTYVSGRGGHHGGDRPRPQPHDKPKSKAPIPGFEPWILVYTKYGRRFAYHPEKNTSYWRIPEKLMKGIIELDIQGAKEKAGKAARDDDREGVIPTTGGKQASESAQVAAPEDVDMADEGEEQELGSDYEEVEVTDDEGAEDGEGPDEDDDGHPSKRQRTEDPMEEMPAEFTEDDIAYQLQAMGADYGLEVGEYDDGTDPTTWPEGAEGIPLSDEDAQELFKDMLNDYGISPFAPWDKLIEDGKIVDDPRYTVLPNMKSRKDTWEEWSRVQIQDIKERRQREEKKDPRIPYLAFLKEKANPKLYWPEFKRKYRKEQPLRDTSLSDKEREKLYREYIGRLKLPIDTLKKDLTSLLKGVPTKDLNNKTMLENLPGQVLSDVRYISLDAKTRDPLIVAYIDTLPPPPEQEEAVADEAARKSREERKKREKAMAERERQVAEEKRRQQRQLEHGRAVLREGEREIEAAMKISKQGIQSQLLQEREKGILDEGAAKNGDE